MQPCAFSIICHQYFSHSLHQKILTECTVKLTTWQSIVNILFLNGDTRTSDGIDMLIDINIYFWDIIKDFKQVRGFYRCSIVWCCSLLHCGIVSRNALSILVMLMMLKKCTKATEKKSNIQICKLVGRHQNLPTSYVNFPDQWIFTHGVCINV